MEPTASPPRWDPPPHFPPALPALPIRAPLSPDDVDSYVSTGSEPGTPSTADAWTGSDSDSEDREPVRVLLWSSSMPLAKVTDDGDEDDVSVSLEEEEDTIFSLVARVPLLGDVSPNPNAREEGLEPMQAKTIILVENPNQEQADSPSPDDVSPNPNASEEGLEPTQAKTVILVEDPNQQQAEFDAGQIGIVMDLEMEQDIAEVGDSDVSTLEPDGGKATEANDSLDRGSLYVDDLKITVNSVDYPDVTIEPEVVSASLKYGAKDEKSIAEFKQTSSGSEIKSNYYNIELAAVFSDSISVKEGLLQADLGEISTSWCTGGETDRSPLTGENVFHSINGGETMDSNDAKEDTSCDDHTRLAVLNISESVIQIIEHHEDCSSNSINSTHSIDVGKVVLASDEEEVESGEEEGSELLDLAKLPECREEVRASTTNGNTTGLSVFRPSLVPTAHQRTQQICSSSSEYTTEPANTMSEGEREFREQIELIRVKFLRLVLKLGYSPDDPVPAQVLHNISRVEATHLGVGNGTQTFSSESARKKAMQQEMQGKGESDFSCNIVVIGKDGVGKSATINSIFGEDKSPTDPFKPKTTSVREILGIMDGMQIRVLDTPGLKLSGRDQAVNRRILSSVKKCMKRCPPDVILYVDRIDTQSGHFNDLTLLRTVNSVLGSSIWSKTIIALTHAASAPPDGPSGSQQTYNFSVDQRSSLVRKAIHEAVGTVVTNPVALVENHPLCKRNTQGQTLLPNGCRWVSHLLLLCYTSKILSKVNNLLNYQNSSFENLLKSFSLSPMGFLSSLQEKNHPKSSSEQGNELDVDLHDSLDREDEEDEYAQLEPLKNFEIAKLARDQRRAYFEEYDDREKLLQKKQWKQVIGRLKEIKKWEKDGQSLDDADDKNIPAQAATPLLDRELPLSFDLDNPVYLDRSLERKRSCQPLTSPVSYAVNWDHDCSYDGVNLEKSLIVTGRFPAEVSAKVIKDKEVFIIHLESAVLAKHWENSSILAGFDVQSMELAHANIFTGKTRLKNWRKNKTAAVVSMTFTGETVATGMKIEDQLSIGKRVKLAVGACAVQTQNDLAVGVTLEATLKEKDYTVGRALSTFNMALMRCPSILGVAANLKYHVSVGRNSNMIVGVSLTDKKSGKITVRTSVGSDQFHIFLAGFVAIALSFFRKICSQK